MHGPNNTTAAVNTAANTATTTAQSEQEQLAALLDAIRELRAMVRSAADASRYTRERRVR